MRQAAHSRLRLNFNFKEAKVAFEINKESYTGGIKEISLEKLLIKAPDRIIKVHIDPLMGIQG